MKFAYVFLQCFGASSVALALEVHSPSLLVISAVLMGTLYVARKLDAEW